MCTLICPGQKGFSVRFYKENVCFNPLVLAARKYAASQRLVLGAEGLHICVNFSAYSCAESTRTVHAPSTVTGA